MKKFKNKKLSHSSKLWITRQNNDPLVELAKKQNYRSRAVFKLIEIDKKLKLIKNNLNIVDLGSAPGSWSQYSSKINKNGINLALDILPMKSISNCKFLNGDFTNEITQFELIKILNGDKADLVLSDIAENSTGNKSLDSMRSNLISLTVLEFALKNLKKNGKILIKTFSGIGQQDLVKKVKNSFKKHLFIKPSASRKDSKELYLYCEL